MSFESRLETERKKYELTYKQAGYKMGRHRLEHAKAILNKWDKGSYLDVGCGRGEMLDVAIQLEFNRVQGVEIVQKLVDTRDDVIQGNGAQLPFADKEFDYVSMLDVVEHIPDKDIYNVFKELARVTNKKLLLCIANFPHKWQGLDLHINIKPYKEWDTILKREFPEWKIVWLRKGRNISETWELTRVK